MCSSDLRPGVPCSAGLGYEPINRAVSVNQIMAADIASGERLQGLCEVNLGGMDDQKLNAAVLIGRQVSPVYFRGMTAAADGAC